MAQLKDYLWLILIVYTIRGILGFVNYWIIFDRFLDFNRNKDKHNWFGLIFYVLVMIAYIPVSNIEIKWLIVVELFLYTIRIVPYLWGKYGINLNILMLALLYATITELVAQNFQYLFVDKLNINFYHGVKNDIALIITELMIFGLLLIMVYFEKKKRVKYKITKLTFFEYIIIFLMNYLYGMMQSYYIDFANSNYRLISIVAFVVLMMLFLHIIVVRDQNISMNSMIGNLKEPMKQITASYIEMNDKNTELRRFRHDTKNHLLALDLLIKDEKYNQATAYIEKLQEVMDTTKEKAYDTGNIIADALIESKAKLSSENGITMTMEGRIPSDNVEDVDLVILISNLLDNAIEAACQVKGEKHIEIQSILKKNIWVFLVKNPCVKDIDIKDNYPKTTKEDKDNHGFGISNIERVIKKYNGKILLSCENQIFTARATLMDCGSEFDQNEI